MDAVTFLVLRQTGGEGGQPVVADVGWQAGHQGIGQRVGRHRGEIGEVDPQQLGGDVGGRIVGEEVDAGDQGVGGYHQFPVGWNAEDGGIVGQAECSGKPAASGFR